MDKLNGCILGLKMMIYQKKIHTIWDKVSADIKKNSIVSLSIIKPF